jgi:hypothetical protein
VAYKSDELIYWLLSDGDTWRLKPVGLGCYLITNEIGTIANDKTLEQAKELVRLADKTITEEL